MLHNIFLVRFLSFLGLIGISILFYSILMETDPMQEVQVNEAAEIKKLEVYSVWALPSEDVRERLKKLMGGLRSEFGGPQFEPHVTVVGAITLTEDEARDKFRKGCEGLKTYNATVEKVGTGTFFYQCVYLLLHPTNERSPVGVRKVSSKTAILLVGPNGHYLQVVEASARCCSNFGYKSSILYMPHVSLLYGDLIDEEKKKAQEKAYILDESIGNLSFQITRLALYKTDTEDKSLKTWEKIEEYNLSP